MDNLTIKDSVMVERPMSEGDYIKVAIRTLFNLKREGMTFTLDNPMHFPVYNVNGSGTKTLCVCPHETQKGAVVLWYE